MNLKIILGGFQINSSSLYFCQIMTDLSCLASRLGGGGGRRRRGEDVTAAIERRALAGQRKSTWKKNRATLLWNYYMKAWHSTPVSFIKLNQPKKEEKRVKKEKNKNEKKGKKRKK
jgi:hypothetical protein